MVNVFSCKRPVLSYTVPSSEFGPPTPGSVSPPESKGGHMPGGDGVGDGPNSDDWRERLSLCLLRELYQETHSVKYGQRFLLCKTFWLLIRGGAPSSPTVIILYSFLLIRQYLAFILFIRILSVLRDVQIVHNYSYTGHKPFINRQWKIFILFKSFFEQSVFIGIVQSVKFV
jgi:hypothetical protein